MDEKRIEIEDKKVIIHKAPATVAYDAALHYRACLDANDFVGTQNTMYELLKYAEIELSDGRRVTLDNKEIINQHFKEAKSMFKLQRAVSEHNFGFFENGAA